MKAVCECGFSFYTEFTACVCPKCLARITVIMDEGMTPAIVSRFYVMPSPGGDPDKVWMRSVSGEAGDFCRHEFEAALGAGMASGQVDEMLERFFWENF